MLNLAFLPDAVAGVIQDGILERRLYKSLRPALNWRMLCAPERHPGRIGERVTKTRSGLISPSTAAGARIAAGGEPALVTRSMEQFGYQVAPYGNAMDIHLPSSFLAIENQFLDDMDRLGFQGAQTVGRMARDAILDAYEGGDTFTTDNPSSTTTVTVKDVKGFSTVLVNGVPTAVSVTNTVPVTIGGTARLVSAVAATDGSSPPKGPGTLTITVALDYAQNDRVKRTEAPVQVRQTARTTDQAILSTDTATIATFRKAAAILKANNVPPLPGTSLYGCFIGPHTKDALFADSEFHDAIQAIGLTGPFADGALGDYAGIRFIEQPQSEMPVLADDADYQTDVHRSLMFGAEIAIEAFIPETDFQGEAAPSEVASLNHYKMALDGQGTLVMVVRAPLDSLGRILRASWAANLDYCIPTDVNNLTGSALYKRAVVIKTAGPAV
jgi:hypothetical protein